MNSTQINTNKYNKFRPDYSTIKLHKIVDDTYKIRRPLNQIRTNSQSSLTSRATVEVVSFPSTDTLTKNTSLNELSLYEQFESNVNLDSTALTQQIQPHQSADKQHHILSLYELCVNYLSDHYSTLIVDCYILPNDTLSLAINTILNNGLLHDRHVTLFYHTLPTLQSQIYLPHCDEHDIDIHPTNRLNLHGQYKLTADGFVELIRCMQYSYTHILSNTISSIDRALYDTICRSIDGTFRSINIQWIDLCCCSVVTNQLLSNIIQYTTNVKRIDLIGCCNVDSTGIQSIAAHCQSLSILTLDMTRIDDYSIQYITQYLKQLKQLSIGNCNRLTHLAMQLLGDSSLCTELQYLCVAGWNEFSTIDCMAFNKFNSLQSLSMRSCHRLTDDDMRYMYNLGMKKTRCQYSKLQSIDIGGCYQLTDHTIQLIVSSNNELSRLDIRGLKLLTDRTLTLLYQYLSKSLISLNITQCTGITTSKIDEFTLLLPNVQIIR